MTASQCPFFVLIEIFTREQLTENNAKKTAKSTNIIFKLKLYSPIAKHFILTKIQFPFKKINI